MPKFRLGVIIGFGAGYYLGAKAGRERYEQLRSFVANSPLSKVQAAYELGIERIKDVAPTAESQTVVPPSNN